jgi:hypothetical protein
MEKYLKITGEKYVYFINLVMLGGKGKFVVSMVTERQVP